MIQSESEYCRRRAAQERLLVQRASTDIAAAVHGELAAAYAARLAKLTAPNDSASRPA